MANKNKQAESHSRMMTPAIDTQEKKNICCSKRLMSLPTEEKRRNEKDSEKKPCQKLL